MQTPTLRDATTADGPAVRELVDRVLAEFGLPPDPLGTDADLADIDRHYTVRGGRFWALTDPDGTVVGCCGLYPLDADRVELRKMYLRPDRRGCGLGRRLLEHAVAEARAAGFRRIELETASVLTDAIRLYRRYGFLRLPGDPAVPRCDQHWALELSP